MKKILFRVDAGGATGLGHFYRSENLASALRNKGHFVQFIHKPSAFWDSLTDFSFPHSDLVGDEEVCMLDLMLKERFNVFYVDGMITFSSSFIEKVRESARVVFYQNLTDAKELADIFILPSIHQEDSFFEKFRPGTKIFKGLAFFTFNKSIGCLKRKQAEEIDEVAHVAVIAGGSDPKNILLTLHGILTDGTWPVVFNYYYGKDYLYADKIPADTEHHRFKKYDVAQILENDLLIAAFGVSTYEFMYLGMPIISLGHQQSNTIASEKMAAFTQGLYHLGCIDDINSGILKQELGKIIQDKVLRRQLSLNAAKHLDLHGIDRVIKIIEHE